MKLSVNVQLSLQIIKDAFGEGLSDVCGFLMRRHKSSWRSIVAETKLPSKQVFLYETTTYLCISYMYELIIIITIQLTPFLFYAKINMYSPIPKVGFVALLLVGLGFLIEASRLSRPRGYSLLSRLDMTKHCNCYCIFYIYNIFIIYSNCLR